MAGFQYNQIIKYVVTAKCTAPLHIGSAVGDKEEVLIHPIDESPFVQASSLAGVFRRYVQNVKDAETGVVDELFGARKLKDADNAVEYSSRIRFSDGHFIEEDGSVAMELRPRVSINDESGVCNASVIKGSGVKGGNKFQMEHIGEGAKFVFTIYLYDINYQDTLEETFAGIQNKEIQIGGQKSNGNGYIQLEKVMRKVFDMTSAEERRLWKNEESLDEAAYEDIKDSLKKSDKSYNAYSVVILGKTENYILVKGIAPTAFGANAPDSENLRNAKGDYIVPGSSLKGAIKNQMKYIADYIGNTEIIDDTFGRASQENISGKIGNISFMDTVIGNQKENDDAPINHRIKIDKFTGGVMNKALFHDKSAFGKMKMNIHIADRNHPDRSMGLLLLALRDLAIGNVSLGGGANIGKGFIDVYSIKIIAPAEEAFIDFQSGTVSGEHIIEKCLKAVQGKEA